jgi:hypothetical protein
VDPDETDMWGSFRNIGSKLLDFGSAFSGSKVADEAAAAPRKPIIWASQYAKYEADKKKGGGGGGAAGGKKK